jgi:hypothetical protein
MAENDAARIAAITKIKEIADLKDIDRETLVRLGFDSGYADGYNAGAASAATWVSTSERLPENVGWYLVSVRELSDLGFSKFTDIVGFVHSTTNGFYWDVKPGVQVEA